MALAAGVLRATLVESANIDQLRREAGVASSRAEIARQRMLLQGRSHAAHREHVREILVALRTVCGAANIVSIARQFEPDSGDVARASRYEALATMLCAEISGGDDRAVYAPLEVDGPDDLARAIHNLQLAVQDYAADTHLTGPYLEKRH